MTRARTSILLVAVVAIFAAIAFYLLRGPAPAQAPATSVVPGASHSQPRDRTPPERSAPPVLPTVSGAAGLEQVRTLSQLSEQAMKARVSRGQWIMELNQAVQLCTNLRLRIDHPSRRDLEQQRSGRRNSLLDAGRKFCDGSQATVEAASAQMLALDDRDEISQALGLRAMSIDGTGEQAVPLAEQLVSSAKDPLAIEAAADLLFQLDRDLPQTKAVPIPDRLRYREAQVDAQRLALEMYTCAVRGGCGEGGLYTMLRCQECGRGVNSLTEAWDRRYPAEVIAYARELANHLAAERR